MSRRLLVGIGWLTVLIGGGGHVWHKWLRNDAPGATWLTGENGPVPSYIREHVIWWALVGGGAIIVFVFSRKAK